MIGGKVLDSSALAAYVRGSSIALLAWLATAQDQGSVLYVPSLALDEVHHVYPDAAVDGSTTERFSGPSCRFQWWS